MSLFKKILNFIGSFRTNDDDESVRGYEVYSKFSDYLNYLDDDDENYEDVNLAVELCDSALRIAKKRTLFEKKAQEYDTTLDEVRCYEKLTEDEIKYLKDLIARFTSLTKERSMLRFQIGDFDPSLNKLIQLEEDAPEAIKRMEDAEKEERSVKKDIAYLNSEKAELEAEMENLKFANKFIYWFSWAMVGIFTVMVIVLVFLNVFKGQVVFLPLAVACILLLCGVCLISVFKKKLNFELKLNAKKQVRAVEYLNKKNVVYAYYHNFLKYEYKKFNVSSAAALKNNMSDFGHYKHITARYDNLRKILFETEQMLENFLRDKHIKDVNASMEGFAKTIDIDDKIAYSKELAKKREKVQTEIDKLDKKHGMIWDKLIELNVNDQTEEHIIDLILKAYLEEVGKLNFPEGSIGRFDIDENLDVDNIDFDDDENFDIDTEEEME
ncbi:MAG: hypothetical protein IJ736_12975 [Firmicutes bacterium]|nr:hypothetical protein [Bacillota bacterium]